MSEIETNILVAFPVSQKTKDGWESLNDEVDLGDGKVGIRKGRDVIEVIVENEETDGRKAQYFDPLTGEKLRRTKRGDGLFSEDEKIWRRVGKGKGVVRKRWKD